jgi:hypothetical protein
VGECMDGQVDGHRGGVSRWVQVWTMIEGCWVAAAGRWMWRWEDGWRNGRGVAMEVKTLGTDGDGQ